MVATDHKPLLGILNDRALDTIDTHALSGLSRKRCRGNLTCSMSLGSNTWQLMDSPDATRRQCLMLKKQERNITSHGRETYSNAFDLQQKISTE